jgi:hypothetical protein
MRVFALRMKADRLARKTCTQYFVVIWRGQVGIVSKPAFKSLRQSGLFPRNFTAEQLKKIAVYHTLPAPALRFRKSIKR